MARRLLETILRLYPRDFRERYEAEMREVLRRDRARGRSVSALRLAGNALLLWVDRAQRSLTRGSFFDLLSLRNAPGFATVVVGVVAIAVALATVASGFLRGTLFRSAVYPDPERVVFAWGSNASNGQLRDVVSGPNFLDLRERTETLEELAALHNGSASFMRDGRPEVLDAFEVTVDFLRVLGVSPALGRGFGEEHRTSGGPSAVILSHAFWREHFAGDPAAVGSALPLNGSPHTVLGVMGPEFQFLARSQVLLPINEDVLQSEDRTFHYYWLIGRLAPGVTPGAATRELSAILSRVASEDPRLSGWSVLVERVDEIAVSGVRPLLVAIGGAVLLVVLAASANLANLCLVRTLGRRRELFVRRAMGARGSEIAALLWGETAILATAGAAVGLALGIGLLRWLERVVPATVPIPGSAATVSALGGVSDLPTLAWGAAAAGLMWSLMSLPSLLARPLRGLRIVVASELALATVLLLGAGLLSRAADRLLAIDPGVDPEGLLTLYVGELEEEDASARALYFREVLRRVEELPSVRSAGFVDYTPFQGEDDFMGFRLLDRPPPEPGHSPREEWRRTSEGYFDAAGIAVVRGRGFEPRDFEVPPSVAMVNEAFARKYWPAADAIGKRLRVALPEYRLLEIVGVVEDVPERGPAEPSPPTFFAPLHGNPRDNMALFVRVSGEPLSAVEAVKEAVWSVDSSQPIDRVFPMEALLENTVALPRLARKLVAQFAGVALGLGALGLFGVSSYAVRTRRLELGIRLALGATPRRLQRELLVELLPLGGIGLAAGVALGIGAAHLGRALLHGISPADPWTVAGAAFVVSGATLVATYLPARGVAGIDPSRSLSSSQRYS